MYTKNKFEICINIFEFISFVFVPDNCIDYEVLIRRNIFRNKSFMTITDHEGPRALCHPLPGISVASNDLGTEIPDYDVPSEFQDKVQVVLRNFSGMLASRNKMGAVNHTSWKNRLEKEVVIDHQWKEGSHENIRRSVDK